MTNQINWPFVIALIIAFVLTATFAYKVTNAHFLSVDEVRQECEKLNGTFEPSVLSSGSCYGIDDEGYRFYWHKDRNGEYYKSK